MDENQRNQIEARLQEERARVNDSLARVDENATIATGDDGDLSMYPTHPADEGTDTQDQEQALVLLTQETEQLALIDDALLRLDRDPASFDKCANCGNAIPFERLDLIPWARYCQACQSQSESSSGA